MRMNTSIGSCTWVALLVWIGMWMCVMGREEGGDLCHDLDVGGVCCDVCIGDSADALLV